MALFDLNRFDRNRFRALVSAFMVGAVLAGCGGGSGGGGGNPPVVIDTTPRMQTFTAGTPTDAQLTGAGGNDVFIIEGDITGENPALVINGVIDGGGGTDEVRLVSGGRVDIIEFSSFTSGGLSLSDIEIITIAGGTVVSRGIITSGARTAMTFNLTSGTITGGVRGSNQDDIFVIGSGIAIDGTIDGGGGEDTVRLATGFTPTSANLLGSILTLTFSGGSLRLALVNIEDVAIAGLTGITPGGNPPPTPLTFSATAGADTFAITTDLTGSPAMPLNSAIDGLTGDDVLELNAGAVVASVAFSDTAPTGGAVNLQNVETITLDGGTVNGLINASAAPVGVTFNLISGRLFSDITGSDHNDVFNLYSAIAISGFLDGGAGTDDELRYAGAPAAPDLTFAGRGGLATDGNTNDGVGDVRNIESQVADPAITSLGAGAGGAPAPAGAGLRGLTVRGIEVLNLSPALNLYGALSDALMQFGQQTAQGFALADLNLATGRATQLVSKDSPFTKGRIWAHKITHSGNGKGSIGLNLTGLTARADSDYDYEMSLTQHGFDAPLAATKLGAFNLRAVSHTMTGTIETNVAEAKVFGYGAGVALQWRGQNFAAHLTSLAGAYEVEAHTSPLNPRAVVSEVSEGSFSAINAVVSAGVADTRKIGHSLVLRTTADIVWQTLSLDDFTETGLGGSAATGITINFDKATRFTARVGAGLEAEHWFSDVAFVHETSSGGTLSSGLSQDYRQDDGTAFEMKLGGKIADLATGLTLKAYAGIRKSLDRSATIEPSARFDLSWRF